MKRAVLVPVLVLLCAGCSHSQVVVDNRTGSSTQGAVQVRAHGGADLATLLGLTIIAATIVDMERESVRLRSDPLWAPVPPLAPDRMVTEHDCTKPLTEFSGNLRCR